MPATPQYHVVLDGQGYLIDPTTYRRRPAARFAPKTRTGEEGYGDFVNGSAWSQSLWNEGFGYEEWDKAHNVQLADNLGVDTSRGDMRPGRPSFTFPTSSGVWQFALFQGSLYGIGGSSAQVWRFDVGGAVTAINTLPTISPVGYFRSIAVSRHGAMQPSLFVGAGDSGKVFRLDPAGTWTLFTEFPGATGIHALADAPIFVTSAPTPSVPSMLVIGVSQVGYIGAGPTAFSANSSLLMTVDYPGTAVFGPIATSPYPHIEAIYGQPDRAGFIYFSTGDLAAGRGELWVTGPYPGGSQQTTRVADLSDNILTCFLEYGDKLLAGTFTRGRIYTVEPTKITEWYQIPEIARAGTPPMYAQRMNQIVLYDDRVYVPVLDVQGFSAYQFDGTGWCRINVPIAGSTQPRGLAAFDNCVYLAGDGATYRFLPAYTTGGVAITPWFDADLGTLDKGWMRVTLAHSVLQTGESIAVAYALDDAAAFTTLGTANVVGASTTVLEFPAGIHGKRFRLRFTFALSSPVHGQRLRSFVVEYNLSSDVVAGNPAGEPPTDAHVKQEFAMEVLLEGTFEHPLVRLDRSVEPKTGDQLRRALWATKAKQSAVAYEDLDGQQYSLWFSDLEDRLVKEHASPEQGWRGTVRLTEE